LRPHVLKVATFQSDAMDDGISGKKEKVSGLWRRSGGGGKTWIGLDGGKLLYPHHKKKKNQERRKKKAPPEGD